MQKKLITIAIIVLLIAAIATAAIYINNQKKNKILEKPDIKTEIKTEKQTNTGAIPEEKKFMNYTGGSYCDTLSDKAKQKDCFDALGKAMNSTSTDACAGLPAEQDKMICQKAAFIKEITASGDFTGCNEITDETNKSVCISQVALNLAISKNDQKYCDKMAYPGDKKSCQDILKRINASSTPVSR
jgi:hypothetical protein